VKTAHCETKITQKFVADKNDKYFLGMQSLPADLRHIMLIFWDEI
jgi:hypothetical protein